jgi:hypothetical protein
MYTLSVTHLVGPSLADAVVAKRGARRRRAPVMIVRSIVVALLLLLNKYNVVYRQAGLRIQ